MSIKLQGDEVQIAFNSRYLLDVLKNVEDDEVVMKLTSGISPCDIEEKNSVNAKYLVLQVCGMR